jgi:hypothetical protein
MATKTVIKARSSNHRGRSHPPQSGPSDSPRPHSNGSSQAEARRVVAKARRPSRIVQEAAAILEQEIAAGITAAKKVEERFVDVKELRSAEADALMHRFRKDAHEIVDIAVDLVQLAIGSAVGLTQNGLPFRLRSTGRSAVDRPTLPPLAVVHIAGPILPGAAGEAQISLENDGEAATAPLKFHISDLVNADGAVISAVHVKFVPASVAIPPRSATRIAISVSIPKDAKPGLYAGIMQASNLDRVRAVVQIHVVHESQAKGAPAEPRA